VIELPQFTRKSTLTADATCPEAALVLPIDALPLYRWRTKVQGVACRNYRNSPSRIFACRGAYAPGWSPWP
jgi:hypothetical protein